MSRQEDTTSAPIGATPLEYARAESSRLAAKAAREGSLNPTDEDALIRARAVITDQPHVRGAESAMWDALNDSMSRELGDLSTAVTRLDDAVMWRGVYSIADRWECVSLTRVGQIVTLLGLRSAKTHRREHKGGTEYSPAAVGLIERELQSRGYSRKAES